MIDDALNAVAAAITDAAGSDTLTKDRAAALLDLANAAAALKFGPDGWAGRTEYHYTLHDEARSARNAGFGAAA